MLRDPLPVDAADEFDPVVVCMTQLLSRPEELPGRTYKLHWPDSHHTLYITINDIVQGSRRRPFKVFVNSKNTEHYAWTVALTRMMSTVFLRGGDVSFVVEDLKAVFDPHGGQWMQGRYVPSLLAAMGDVIDRHKVDIRVLPGDDQAGHGDCPKAGEEHKVVRVEKSPRMRQCPK